MPTYQYACADCGESLEVVQSFSDASLTECPACGGRLRKKYGAVGVVFKGSGFYKTDSRSEAKKGASSGADAAKDAAPKKDAPAAAPSTPSAPSSTGSSSSSSGSGSSTSAA